MNLTQRQLRMFVTTARLLNISRASEVLHISQPALTRALHEFERQLGVDLLERTTRNVRLTPQGESFLPVAQRLLNDLDHAARDIDAHAHGVTGSLTVAVGAAFGATVLPTLVDAFTQAHPGVRLRLIDDNSAGITARVARAEADLGIGSPMGNTGLLTSRLLLSASLGLLADPARFHLPREPAAADLDSLPLLNEPADTSIVQVLSGHGSDLVARMQRGVEVSHLGLQLELARAGVGVAVLSALGASHPMAAGLRFHPLRPALRREIHLMHRNDRQPGSAAAAFIAALPAALRKARLHRGVKLAA